MYNLMNGVDGLAAASADTEEAIASTSLGSSSLLLSDRGDRVTLIKAGVPTRVRVTDYASSIQTHAKIRTLEGAP